MKLPFVMAGLMLLPGCIWEPPNRQNQDNTTAIPLQGYAKTASDVVSFKALNQTTGSLYTFPSTATASSTPTLVSGGYNMYGWSLSLTPAADFWTPQQAWNGLTNGPGRIELTGYSEGTSMYTFSVTAQQCFWTQVGMGASYPSAGAACYDGTTLVAFDNNGVGNLGETFPWTLYAGPYNDTVGSDTATWEVGVYEVQSKLIYGVMCHPSGSGAHRAVVINHGGFDGIDNVGLSYCLNGAHSGWLTAMSAYRGEWVNVNMPASGPVLTNVSGGNVELCQGEVTDAMRLLDIVRARSDVDTTRVLMWGHSHGGCITQRAVEHGALVTAAAAFSGPSDFDTWSVDAGNPVGWSCPLGQNVVYTSYTDLHNVPPCVATPWATIATAPAAYTVRSSALTASDLWAVGPTVPFLIIHGVADTIVPTDQACELAYKAWGPTGDYWHWNASNVLTTAQPSPALPGSYCPLLTWITSPSMPTMPGQVVKPGRYLAVYDGYDHGGIVALGSKPWNDFQAWVSAAIP